MHNEFSQSIGPTSDDGTMCEPSRPNPPTNGISRQEVDNAERRAVTKIRRAVADDAELREAAAELLGLAEGEIQRVAWKAVK